MAKKSKATHIEEQIKGIVLIALAIFLGIGVYFNNAGALGNWISGVTKGFFGIVTYAIPVFLAIWGFDMVAKSVEIAKVFYRRAVVLIILLSFFFSLTASDTLFARQLGFGEFISLAYQSGIENIGGGILGAFVAPLVTLFDIPVTYVILISVIIINLIFITGITPKQIIQRLSKEYKARKDNIPDVDINAKFNEKKAAKQEQAKTLKRDFSEFNLAEKLMEDEAKVQEKRFEQMKIETEEIIPGQDDKKIILSTDTNNEKPKVEKKEKDDEEVPVINIDTKEAEDENYVLPDIELLQKPQAVAGGAKAKKELLNTASKLEATLASFGVDAKVINVTKGPTVTRYELSPSIGVKVSKIVGLSDDIALSLAAPSIRMEAPIPGKSAIGIEIPNTSNDTVFFREIVGSDKFEDHKSKLAFAIGKDIAGNAVVTDIAKMPHVLIAGATGSGKSVCINTLISSILYKAKPNEVKLIMVDPKVVELGVYNGIPHLLIPVVTDPKKAAGALNWAVQEMVNRYNLFASKNVRDLKGYNEALKEEGIEELLPQVVIIIDELADLMMVAPNDVEDAICRLAQMARAAGMHLVIATQRPSVDVITGVIKANIPSRIAFSVSSQIDSRTILDMSGAEKLLGKGDMLFYPIGESKPVRLQGAFITDKEVENVVAAVKANHEAKYDEDVLEKIQNGGGNVKPESDAGDNDPLLYDVIDMVVEAGQASTSMIQRRFKVGYARAARIIDQMEERGIIGGYEGSRPRQLHITKTEWEEMKMGEKKSEE